MKLTLSAKATVPPPQGKAFSTVMRELGGVLRQRIIERTKRGVDANGKPFGVGADGRPIDLYASGKLLDSLKVEFNGESFSITTDVIYAPALDKKYNWFAFSKEDVALIDKTVLEYFIHGE
jgi:hypothetical protein